MAKFNLEKANAGEPIQLENGWSARLLCDDLPGPWPLAVAVFAPKGCRLFRYSARGKNGDEISVRDLVMAPTKHQMWVNVYEDACGKRWLGKLYETEQHAEDAAKNHHQDKYIETVLVHEWEA